MAVQNDEHGRTMIEVILYLCILIVLGATITKTVTRIFDRYNVGRASQQIIDLKKTILMYTAADEDYTKLSKSDLEETNSMPYDMQDFRHALGGNIFVGPASQFPSNNDDDPNNKYMFFITFDRIDKASCIEILSQGQFYSTGSEMDTLNVNGKWWQYKYSLYTEYGSRPNPYKLLKQQRLTIPDAMEGCTDNTNNIITWIFS